MRQQRNAISIVACAAAVLSLAGVYGCENNEGKRAYTHMGTDIGKDVWNEISDSDSTMWIANAPGVRKIEASTSVTNRYRERIYLSPGIIKYEKITGPFNTAWGLKESAYQQIKNYKSFKNTYGLNIQRNDVKERYIGTIRYAFLSKEGDKGVCFFFFSVFGRDWGLVDSLGDTHVEGGACHRSGSVTSSNLEEDWIELLSRLRFDGPKPGWTNVNSSQTPPLSSRKVIEITQPDEVYEFGRLKYKVERGDKLEVVNSKICRGGSGTCWEVVNTKTGEIGYVNAGRMKRMHRIHDKGYK